MSIEYWSGGYTSDAGGQGEGIHLLSASTNGRLQNRGIAIRADSPSFFAVHPHLPRLYAVSEMRGTVAAYTVREQGHLERIGEDWPAGKGACHVAVDASGRFISVACWGSGEVVVYPLSSEGRLTARQVAEPAEDPHGPGSCVPGADPDPFTGERRRSRAHATLTLSDGRLVSTDLGYDLLRFWTYERTDGLRLDHEVALPSNSGPRHLLEHPDGRLLVVTEYSCEIVALARYGQARSASFVVQNSVRAVELEQADKASELTLSPDARHLYVSIRGSNRVATADVGDGRLEVIAVSPSGGRCPRQAVVDDRVLHVLHEESHEVVTVARDPASGRLGRVLHRLPLGSPTFMHRVR